MTTPCFEIESLTLKSFYVSCQNDKQHRIISGQVMLCLGKGFYVLLRGFFSTRGLKEPVSHSGQDNFMVDLF